MILRFGNHRHDDGEVALTIARDTTFSEARIPVSTVHRWDISGMLVGDTQAEITTKILALEAAYRQTGVDAILYSSDGTTETAHKLKASEAIGGIRVVGFGYPDGSGAEYSTYRRYRIQLEAETLVSSGAGGGGTISTLFRESIRTVGGGPIYAWTRPLRGLPIRQLVREQSTYRAVQSGQATSRYGYPAIPGPINAAALMEAPEITRSGPTRLGGDYEVAWSYTYESSSPIAGNPNIRF